MLVSLLALTLLATPPKEHPTYTLTASTYGYPGDRYHADGMRTASGARFNPRELTAAVDPRRLREGWGFGTRLVVWTTNPERRVIVRVTDTMNRRFRDNGRERIDLSWGAWQELFPDRKPGINPVRVRKIEVEK